MSLTKRSQTMWVVLAVFLHSGCGDAVSGGGDQVGDGDGDSSTGTDAGYVDQVPCAVVECSSDDECCRTASLATAYSHMDCSSTSARLGGRWSCDKGECVHAGCESDADCQNAVTDLEVTWKCADINSVGFCIQPCTTDDDCHTKNGNAAGATECSGVTDDQNVFYCKEPPA